MIQHAFAARFWRAAVILLLWTEPLVAIDLLTQEQMVESLARRLPVEQPLKIFSLVFSALHKNVDVHPSENYYYFQFSSNGIRYWGNLRLSPILRDEGKLHFAYAEEGKPETIRYRLLGPEDGIRLTEQAPLVYRLVYRGKAVNFHLNDLPQAKPETLNPPEWEEFIARSEDESGLRFLLMYNKQYRHFYWVLDSKQAFDIRLRRIDKAYLYIHDNSQFVFYRDSVRRTFILAGVRQANIAANNYYDGPFDQLADNILDKTSFSQRLREAYIETRGKINARGELAAGSRIAIIPYLSYRDPVEISAYQRHCQDRYQKDSSAFYFCLFRDQTRSYGD